VTAKPTALLPPGFFLHGAHSSPDGPEPSVTYANFNRVARDAKRLGNRGLVLPDDGRKVRRLRRRRGGARSASSGIGCQSRAFGLIPKSSNRPYATGLRLPDYTFGTSTSA
jgi:hypothetical protein